MRLPGAVRVLPVLLILVQVCAQRRPVLDASIKSHVVETTLEKIVLTVNSQPLPDSDRMYILETAARVLEEYNPFHFLHLNFLKINPGAELRALKSKLQKLSNFQFHTRITRIFSKMNDFHSVYLPPEPLFSATASLGFVFSRYYEPGKTIPTYFIPDSNLTVLLFDGVPVHKLATKLGNEGYGSNTASKQINGLRALSIRRLLIDPAPQKLKATILYKNGTATGVLQVPWQYYIAINGNTTTQNGRRKDEALFRYTTAVAPRDPRKELYDAYHSAQIKSIPMVRQTEISVEELNVSSIAKVLFQAFEITTPATTYGYIDLKTFFPEPPSGYKKSFGEFIDFCLTQLEKTFLDLPHEGLVVDITGNPGGYLALARLIFDIISPKNVPPLPQISRATNLTKSMYTMHTSAWADTFRAAVTEFEFLGEQFTGPVVNLFNYPDVYDGYFEIPRFAPSFTGNLILLTDANSYSAADTISAWIQDTNAGLVVGLDENTGGGGAFVENYSELRSDFPKTFTADFPAGTDFSTAVRRFYRNGGTKTPKNAGTLLENVGVRPDKRYFLTYRDATHDNVDLKIYLGSELAKMS